MVPTLRFNISLMLIGGGAMVMDRVDTVPRAVVALVIADAMLLLLTAIDYIRGGKRKITVQRQPLDPLSIGRKNPVTISVENSGPTAIAKIKDDYPAPFLATDELKTAQVLPQGNTQLSYQVHARQRGEYRWGKVNVRQLCPWQLTWHQWTVGQQETVTVHPDLMGLKSLTIRLAQATTGNLRQMRKLGLGTEFRELRDYQAGDDLRYLDWKASARRGIPLMRVLEPEREQTVIILLDRGRLMTAWVQGLQRFDWGLNTSLALAVAALHRGDRLGIGVFDREVVGWLPPERGLQYLPKLLKTLSPIQPVLQEPDYGTAIGQLVQQQTRRALVVCITDLIDPTASRELLTALTQLAPRYLPFCVTLRDPQVDQLAHAPATTVSGAYQKAVAINLLQQRQLALVKLRQKGVLVLDAPADKVSEQLVDRYLQLKARTLL